VAQENDLEVQGLVRKANYSSASFISRMTVC